MPCIASRVDDRARACGKVAALVGFERTLQGVARGRAAATTSAVGRTFHLGPHPWRNYVLRGRQRSAEGHVKERIVQGIVDPFRKLSGERLYVALLHERRHGPQI